jgi:hypothetical protein
MRRIMTILLSILRYYNSYQKTTFSIFLFDYRIYNIRPNIIHKNTIMDAKIFKIPVKDARMHTGKAILPNTESTYITEYLMSVLELHHKVKAEYTLLDANFWLTAEDYRRGCAGHAGCMYAPGKCPCQICTPKPITPVADYRYILSIKCIVTEDPSDMINRVTKNKFVLTEGPRGNFLTPIACIKKQQLKTVKFAVVPKPETIEAFQILYKHNPILTIEDLVTNEHYDDWEDKYKKYLINTIFILNEEDIPKNALEVNTKNVVDNSDLVYEIIFQMIACDFAKNMDVIKEFLTELSKMNFIQ